jgi:hypothetical protein
MQAVNGPSGPFDPLTDIIGAHRLIRHASSLIHRRDFLA